MLDMRDIRNRAEEVRGNLRYRNVELDLDALLEADKQAREIRTELDNLRQRRNEIANTMQSLSSQEERAPLIEEGRALKEKEDLLEQAFQEAGQKRGTLQALVRLGMILH